LKNKHLKDISTRIIVCHHSVLCDSCNKYKNYKYHDGFNRNNFLMKNGPRGWEYYNVPPSREYGMFVVKILRGALKLRYILLGGAIGGGVTLNQVCSESFFLNIK